MFDADGVEHTIERYSSVAEIGLVIAYADRMPRGSIDHRDLDPVWPDANFVKPASGPDRSPQARKARTQNQNALNRQSPLMEVVFPRYNDAARSPYEEGIENPISVNLARFRVQYAF